MDNLKGEMVVELRLKVPIDAKAAWLNAEKIWDHGYLQEGFLGDNYFGIKKKKRL